MRRKRRALDSRQQQDISQALCNLLQGLRRYRQARRVAFYLPNDGEADPRQLMEYSLRKGKTCYLPVIHPLKDHHLHFARYLPTTPLVKNQFGIPEPRLSACRIAPLWTLDIIFVPLVAFDRAGTRLGMGGGYYDRTLANTRIRKPLLIGLAHSCQELEHLERSAWDIALDAIATEKELIIIGSATTRT